MPFNKLSMKNRLAQFPLCAYHDEHGIHLRRDYLRGVHEIMTHLHEAFGNFMNLSQGIRKKIKE